MKKILIILILSLSMINLNTFASEKTYFELTTEYNTENSKSTGVDYKKLDAISEEIIKKVKSEENKKNYEKYSKVFTLVLNKAKKDNQTFWEFYNFWMKFRYKIDDYIATGKVKNEKKLELLYTVQTTLNETINWLCDKIWWCGLGQDDAIKLKNIK